MKRGLLTLLTAYKRWISPALPNACRFVPTCSEYAMEAVERHGALRGSLLAAGRVLRCHPLAKSGYDPVPGPMSRCAHSAVLKGHGFSRVEPADGIEGFSH